MAIMASAGPSFTPAPAGTHAAVCVDVVDLGVVETNWQGKVTRKHKVSIVWQIDEDRDDGKPFAVRKRYTLSLHEKAALRKDLESWRGRAFTEEELQGFDLENLLRIGCLLNIIHASKDGQTYSNVASIMKLPKGMQAPEPRDYVRVCDRPAEQGVGIAQPSEEGWAPTDEDVPF
jgi:hypothetical protein